MNGVNYFCLSIFNKNRSVKCVKLYYIVVNFAHLIKNMNYTFDLIFFGFCRFIKII